MNPNGYFRRAMNSGHQPDAQARDHAFYAHLAGAIVGLISGGVVLPIFAPTIVLLLHDRRDPFVYYHVNQAFWFHLIVSFTMFVLGAMVALISFVTCGMGVILFLPLMALGFIAAIYGFVMAFQARAGSWSGYAAIGEFVLDQESPVITPGL